MARLPSDAMGPASSTGSPITFMMRPSVPAPTGTMIGLPVSPTSWPRTRPSAVSMAMVRTVDSPRCCATSSTRRLPPFCVSSAFRIAGRCPSNCTSTTAPMTWVMRPVATAISSSLLSLFPPPCPGKGRNTSQCFGARDDLDQFLGDHRLACAIVGDGLLADHLARIARRVVHCAHARTLLRRGVFQQCAQHLNGDIARQQIVEDVDFLGLVVVG